MPKPNFNEMPKENQLIAIVKIITVTSEPTALVLDYCEQQDDQHIKQKGLNIFNARNSAIHEAELAMKSDADNLAPYIEKLVDSTELVEAFLKDHEEELLNYSNQFFTNKEQETQNQNPS